MADLAEQLRQCLQGRVCLLALGNKDYADDGLGVVLGEELLLSETWTPPFVDSAPDRRRAQGLDRGGWTEEAMGDNQLVCVIAGTTPDRFLSQVAQEGLDHLILLDAVDFGGVPGSVILLDAQATVARFPQVSTHKISLGLLAKWAEANGTTHAWLLGVQPGSLQQGGPLTASVRLTLDILQGFLAETSTEGVAC
jgi:hydrogenase maturation protease